MKNHYRTIVISDVHLGTSGSKAKEVTQFLKSSRCDRLILNGDIIDGWQLKKYGRWQKRHTKFFKRVLKMIEKDGTEVIYLRGNHDDFLDEILPLNFGKFSICREYILQSGDKRFYITHGDIFDAVTTHMKWIASLGDIGYTFLLWLNKYYNQYRSKRGLPYFSLSQYIKGKVKAAVSFISEFEEQLVVLAKYKKCDGIICGHIHQPAIKQMGELVYMNSGDWVESLSALVETHDGQWELVYYNEENHLEEEELEADEEDAPDMVNVVEEIMALKYELKASGKTSSGKTFRFI
jgi:UDP-2,3-diacylglucosamine pyrophosphatase LpxH